MIDLFIDLGNSRIKFAVVDDEGYEYIGAYPIKPFKDNTDVAALLASLNTVPDNVYVASVSSETIEHELREAISSLWSIFPIFLNTQVQCCELKNGYKEPLKLGVDRWMSLVGASAFKKSSFLVVDAGTAITLDAVHDNQHLGGFIVPGIQTMRESLSDNTAKLTNECDAIEEFDTDEASSKDLVPTDTQTAICAGTLYMAASFIDSAIFDLEHELGCRFKVFVTGGDGYKLASLINSNSEYIEDLVLLGMINMTESVKK